MSKIYNLLNKNGKFVLSIEKDTEEKFGYMDYNVKMYPDNLETITKLLKSNEFHIEEIKETEKAYLVLSIV